MRHRRPLTAADAAGSNRGLLDTAMNALIEAQAMSGSIGLLVDQLIVEAFGRVESDGRLQAIKACLMRMDAAVDPASDLLTMRAA